MDLVHNIIPEIFTLHFKNLSLIGYKTICDCDHQNTLLGEAL